MSATKAKPLPTSAPHEVASSLRRSVQEVEIDHLLAEEFACDQAFAEAFLTSCGLSCPTFRVSEAIAEPSLGGSGFGDLFVLGAAANLKVAILVEDKISAAPAVRQAERYAAHAQTLRDQGFDLVWTVLVAPASYRGERDGFDADIDLETVVTLVNSADPVRQAYRRGIIERALEKRRLTGVQVPDVALHDLKAAYLRHAKVWCAENGIALELPALKDSYYDGDAWIDHVRCPMLPSPAYLRHRLWTSMQARLGSVDLIVSPASQVDAERFRELSPEGAIVDTFSKGKGIKISLAVPEMRQGNGFDQAISEAALESMKRLIDWYRQLPSEP